MDDNLQYGHAAFGGRGVWVNRFSKLQVTIVLPGARSLSLSLSRSFYAEIHEEHVHIIRALVDSGTLAKTISSARP